MKNFFLGISYNFKGLNYFFQNRSLWKYAIIPLVINIIALVALISLYLIYFNDLFFLITKSLGTLDILSPNGFLWHLLDALLWVLRFFLQIIFFLLSFVLIFVAVFILSSLLNAPFYEIMSEQVLIMKNDLEDRPFKLKTFLSEFRHALKIELCKLAMFASLFFMIILFSWIPVIGPIFALIGFFFTSWVFAFGLSTYPMIIHKQSFKKMLNWASTNKSTLIGFGLPSTIPILGLLIIHFQVIGGTLLYLEHKNPE